MRGKLLGFLQAKQAGDYSQQGCFLTRRRLGDGWDESQERHPVGLVYSAAVDYPCVTALS